VNRNLIRIFALALFALAGTSAHAAITCSISSGGWSTAYVTTATTTNVTQSSFTLTCQRNVAADSTSLSYVVSVDNGIHFQGQGNHGQNGTSQISYENYRDSGCTALWKSQGGNRISGAMTLSGFVGTTVTTTYWGCVPAGQTGLPSGSYTDTVTMSVSDSSGGGAAIGSGTFGITIYYPAVCNVTQAPADVAFTYTAFRATPATASSTFGVTCTTTLPYTMALDATSGVVAGLQYLVSLSASTGTGTGAQQNYTISGTMPAGQAGTCATSSCTGTSVRTLTIGY